MIVARDWEDYKIIDMANGQKLEKWENIVLSRPDPQIIWKEKSFSEECKKPMLFIIGQKQEAVLGNTTKSFQKIGK